MGKLVTGGDKPAKNFHTLVGIHHDLQPTYTEVSVVRRQLTERRYTREMR